MTYLLTGAVILAILFLLLTEAANRLVLGGWIGEEDLDAYLGKYYDRLELNEFSQNGDLFSGAPKFIAKSWSPTSKWYIKDYGIIPRWSKWSGKLDYKRSKLMTTQESFINHIKPLKDL